MIIHYFHLKPQYKYHFIYTSRHCFTLFPLSVTLPVCHHIYCLLSFFFGFKEAKRALYNETRLFAVTISSQSQNKKKYGLDPAHYYSAPGLSWDAFLKKTGVELELLTDLDMHLFIERGMRGGISMVGKRYAKANNPLVEGYNPDEPTNYITYLDANNLYGWAMSMHLPKSGFHWKCVMPTEEQITKMKWNAKKGWILQVDLEYPEYLHDAHNGYPLAPEKGATEPWNMTRRSGVYL